MYFLKPTPYPEFCKITKRKPFKQLVNRCLPSCSCVRHKSPCCGHSWDLPADYRTQIVAGSFHVDVGIDSDGTAGLAPSPAGANTLGSQHPIGPSAEKDTR